MARIPSQGLVGQILLLREQVTIFCLALQEKISSAEGWVQTKLMQGLVMIGLLQVLDPTLLMAEEATILFLMRERPMASSCWQLAY